MLIASNGLSYGAMTHVSRDNSGMTPEKYFKDGTLPRSRRDPGNFKINFWPTIRFWSLVQCVIFSVICNVCIVAKP